MASVGVKGMIVACDFINALNAIVECRSDHDDLLKKARLVNKLILAGFSLSDLAYFNGNVKIQYKLIHKSSEYIFRFADFITSIPEAFSDSDGSFQGVLKAIQIVASSAFDTFRVAFEHSALVEQKYIEEVEKNPEATRPEYEVDARGEVNIKGYKKIDKAECERNKEISDKCSAGLSYARIITESGIVGKTAVAVNDVYRQLIEFLDLRNQERNELIVDGRLNLARVRRIPLPLHDNDFFRQHICPITHEPIRDPVLDPNGITVYERSAILNWIRIRPVSPVTRQPLRADQLAEMPALRAEINRRLREFEPLIISRLRNGEEDDL